MKTLLIVVSLLALTGGCKKEVVAPDNACTTTNPLENVKWIKDLKDLLDNGYYHGCIGTIFQATYLQQTVYFTMITDSACEYIPGEALLNAMVKSLKPIPSRNKLHSLLRSLGLRRFIHHTVE